MSKILSPKRDSLQTYTFGGDGRLRRAEELSMRLRVGAFAGSKDVAEGTQHTRDRARGVVDAWADASGRMSVLARTLRRSALDIERASRDAAGAMRALVSSMLALVLRAPVRTKTVAPARDAPRTPVREERAPCAI